MGIVCPIMYPWGNNSFVIHYNGQRLATERSFRSFDDAALEQSTTDTGQPGIIMKNKEKGGALSTNHMGEFVGNPHLHRRIGRFASF